MHKARHTQTGEIVALKKMRLEGEDDGVPATALREIAILRELKHQNIIELMHVFHTEKSLYLAFEYCDSDLKQYMRSIGNKLSSNEVQSYCWQLINGLAWCHSHRIFHRDLKPQNLLVQPSKGLLKLGDFGLTRAFSLPLRTYTHEVVTLWYRPPEILLGAKDYGCPIDMWAVGCVLGEMTTGRPMFPGDSEIDEIFKIFQVCVLQAHILSTRARTNAASEPSPPLSLPLLPFLQLLGTPSPNVWEDVSNLPDFQTRFPTWKRQDLSRDYGALGTNGIDLLTKLITYDPRQRIVGKDALCHSYFDSFDPEVVGKGPIR